ncbi:11974_t:CDS:2 [Funneliformis mosseae]|uniref:11974_t:CDS:1 n=1 Tax=Funneliformis mosseae TaxID=27381 RepID=A0A9N9D5R3_FUNMO|nr:11974_t:CDS:2 [Funneliformis mosseae]
MKIGLELMLGYYVSIDSLDDGLEFKPKIAIHCIKYIFRGIWRRIAELIAELNCDVGKIKQEQIAINVSVQDGTSVVKSSTRSELQVTSQSSISPPIEGNSENSSDVAQPTHAGQDQDEPSISQNNSSMPLEDSAETKTNTSSSQSSTKSSVCRAEEAQVLPKDTKVSMII